MQAGDSPTVGRGIDQSCQCRGDTRTVCTPPAGCGKQSRDLTRLCTVFRPRSGQRRPARATKVRVAGAVHSPNSAAKFNIPVERSTGRIQNQPASAYFVPVKQKVKEVICPSLMRGMAGEYPETPGIWERWHASVQLRRLPHSCGREVARKEKSRG